MKVPSAPETDSARVASPAGAGQLAHGRRLDLSRGANGPEQLRIVSPSGEIELLITIGPAGPRLTVRAVDLELIAQSRLSVQCGELDVRASGAATIVAGETLKLAGLDAHISAERGEIQLRANDDVNVRGERIRLNSDAAPLPASWEEFEARRKLRA